MAVELIELGDEWTRPREDPGAPPLPPSRAVLLALALLLVGALGAGAAPQRRITELATYTMPGVSEFVDGGAVSGDDLLLVWGGGRLSAYRPSDGTLRWSVPLDPRASTDVTAQAAEGLVLLSGGGTTTVLDSDYGTRLWSVPVPLLAVGGVGVYGVQNPVFVGPDGKPYVDEQSGAEREEATGYDLRTGRVLWTVPGVPYASVVAARGEVWTVTTTGAFTVYGIRDGLVLRTGTLAFPPGRPYGAHVYGDDQITLSAVGPEDAVTEIRYDLATLRVRREESDMSYPCGRFRCSVEPVPDSDDFHVTVRDRDTGAARYQLGSRIQVMAVGDWFATVDLHGSPGTGLAVTQLIDQATGRVLLDLTGWEVLPAEDASGGYLLLRDAGGQTLIGTVVDGEVQLLGLLKHRVRQCRYRDDWLACDHTGTQLTMWRIAVPEGRRP
ncbi:outer membrane protein assembly factor BamB family protein [Catellatospora tritici]|uniref:outer membrane protein assembly factor BamB family protein n=1 Tax=Catellatospora tritici TaxID=2851566 RepID=UPI001C2D9089|nr:PQQ-binding-like beta-propeller repeat protein [Catellatospora tritici]MBV1851522.1 PQQ-like beta-propeller repeat protein [Catellatospora tritici]